MALGICFLAPVALRAQTAASTSPPPARIFKPALSPYQEAKALAEAKCTNIPPRIPPGTELTPPYMSGELVEPLPNYWDGVDEQGNLHVFIDSDPVLNDVGVFGATPFPPSVNVADMNDDQLPDIVVGDRCGYLWIFFNAGKKGQPKFTTGTLYPTFLDVTCRINVADWDGDKDNDIIIGDFYGHFYVLPNIGSAKQPKFTVSMGLPRVCADPRVGLPKLMLGTKPFEIGIYMAPWAMDWNGDGKKDLIFGEGTYSANSVRIAFNTGGGKPIFTEEQLYYLAYGEGFEQLVPSVLDYNGDGLPDVMCGTRNGQIRLYRGTGKSVDAAHTFRGIKQPAAMDFDRNLLIDHQEVIDKMTAPFPCDWNEDGLFDIVMGSTKGLILVSLNTGTKSEPLFDKIEPVTGVNTNEDLVTPSEWLAGQGTEPSVVSSRSWGSFRGRDYHCNSARCLSSEKEVVLKEGMSPIKPVEGQYFLYYRYMDGYPGWTAFPGYTHTYSGHNYYQGEFVFLDNKWMPGARGFGTTNVGVMAIGRQYEFSFSYVLVSSGPVEWRIWSWESFKEYNEEYDDYDGRAEQRTITGTPLMPNIGWQKVTMNFTCPGVQKGQMLPFPKVTVPGVGVPQEMKFDISFTLPPGDARLLLDNFSLKEKGLLPGTPAP